MIKWIYSFLIVSVCGLAANAQENCVDYLKKVEANNFGLKVAKKRAEQAVVAASTGIAPDDPQFSFGHVRNGGEYEQEVEFMQGFDFPTVYIQRMRLAKQSKELAGKELKWNRQELLLQAQKEYFRYVFLEKKHVLTEQQKASTLKLGEAIDFRYKIGDATVIEQQKVSLANTSAENFCKLVTNEINQQIALLELIAGQKGLKLETETYPIAPSLTLDSILALYRNAPQVVVQQQRIANAESRVGLAKAQWLPSFAVGYAQVTSPVENLSGVRASISIPLWRNRNTVRSAKAQLASEGAVLVQQELVLEQRVRALFAQQQTMATSLASMREAIEKNDVPAFLLKALKEGEMSLIDYLNEIGFFYEKKLELLELEYNYKLVGLELYKVLL